MADFKWTSANEIGHPGIDEQHKRLFLLAGAAVEPLISSAERKPGAAQLQALIDFAQEHFAFEEGLMRSAAYPGAVRHAKYHVSLLTELKSYCARLNRGRNADPASLIEFLRNWLLLHIDSEDRNLLVWLKSQESSGGARRDSS